MNEDNLNETNDYLNSSAPEIVSLLDDYLARLKAGEAPDREAFLANHPTHAEQLQACLASLDFLSKERDDLLGKKQVGDFRIIGEIGQGGMGTVYEAEQISLGRKVALKIIRAGRQSEDSIERFKREAETVATLHHTNIVPVFSVGAESEINYFAMQLIDGQSLSEVSRESNEPIDPIQATEWGLGVVEALAHAHERGVVHRDVKPSNILLDIEGGIWLSDFGLAKRTDDLTLSVTGAILGTPRYMSPEQARGATDEVDERSDIYSFGATLYELVTKSPVFDADSPHKIIGKIIHDEPESPRSRVNSLPRDLETILLKCLQKQPADRYQTAEALADDLRSFVHDRPIASRPVGLIEKSSRWLRKKRSAMAFTAIAAAATLLIALLGIAIESWRELNVTSEYLFSSDVPGAAAEFFDKEDDPVGSPISLPTRNPVSLRRGEYSVQVSAPGRFSVKRPIVMSMNPNLVVSANYPKVSLNLNSRLAGPPIGFENSYAALPGQNRVVTLNSLGLACHEVRTGTVNWRSNVDDWEIVKQRVPHFQWEWPFQPGFAIDLPNQYAPVVLTDVGDLDADGEQDFILAAQHSNWLVAVSVASGEPIWASSFLLDESDDPSKMQNGHQRIVGSPLVVDDLDGDQIKDIVSIADHWPVSVRAFSGRTGETIWTVTNFDPKSDKLDVKKKWGSPHPLQLATIDGEQLAVAVIGKNLTTLTLPTGEIIHSVTLTEKSDYRPLVQDIDGDGSSDIAIMPNVVDTNAGAANARTPNSATVEVWSIKEGTIISEIEMDGTRSLESLSSTLQFVDLENDGQMEVIRTGTTSGHVVQVTDLNGNERWKRATKSVSPYRDPFLVGPDIDKDGHRDIFVATFWQYERFDQSEPGRLFVDAYSGKDGRTIWSSSAIIQDGLAHQLTIKSLTWWKQSDATWPTFVATVHPQQFKQKNGTAFTACFSSADGELQHLAEQVAKVDAIDIDGDHIEDLVAYAYDHFRTESDVQNRRLMIVPGRGKTAWNKSGGYPLPVPTPDLNGDGSSDLVQVRGTDAIRAISGTDGSLLWKNSAPFGTFQSHEVFVPPAEHVFDIDNDGVQDLLWIGHPPHAWGNQPLCVALSGATGHQLWECNVNVTDADKLNLIELKDLDADGVQEIILVGSLNIGPKKKSRHSSLVRSYPSPYPVAGLKMLVLSQRTGQLKWKKELGEDSEPYLDGTTPWQTNLQGRRPNEPFVFDVGYVDANNDGVLDIITPVQQTNSGPFELRVLDGRNGEASDPIKALRKIEKLDELPRIATLDLDGQGTDEIVSVSVDPVANTMNINVEATTASGQPLWRWSSNFMSLLLGRGNDEKDSYSPLPTVLRHKTGIRFAINVLGIKNSIVILDAAGKVVGEPIQLKNEDLDFKCWSVDVNDDGFDELLTADKGKLKAFSFDDERRVLWERDLVGQHDHNTEVEVDVRTTSEGVTELVVHANSLDHRVVGLDPTTGKTRWTCPLAPQSDAVMLAGSDKTVRVVDTVDYVMYCREAVPVKRGAVQLSMPARLAAKPIKDIRNRRYLPWAKFRASDWLRMMPTIIGWGLFNVTALLIIPGVMLRRVVTKRQWSARSFLLLPVAASIFFLDVIVARTMPFQQKLTLAFLFLPFAAYLVRQLFLLRNRKWRWSIYWVVMAAVACVPMLGVYWYAWPWYQAEGDYLVLDYWYVGLLIGAWGAGLLIAFQMAMRALRHVWKTWFKIGLRKTSNEQPA